MAKIVPFKGGKSRAKRPSGGPARDELAIRIREAARRDLVDLSDHARTRMGPGDRNVSMREVTECLRQGEGQGQPRRDEFGEWGIFMVRRVAGRRIKVRAAMGAARVTVVTVYPPA